MRAMAGCEVLRHEVLLVWSLSTMQGIQGTQRAPSLVGVSHPWQRRHVITISSTIAAYQTASHIFGWMSSAVTTDEPLTTPLVPVPDPAPSASEHSMAIATEIPAGKVAELQQSGDYAIRSEDAKPQLGGSLLGSRHGL